ncbi:type II toxin-antitoxin system RelE/ParE family toxin [Magnetospirillum sp. UT-4]|uniref:type II toxin-antitoxin system RelE/ParE family toxin n=1 Tax=Magnetospirillum sp. UT-4 TaxID=2681467 RepID=UPI0013865474|nr:type II toxin-antitoxin system RelE/ParE family toxin [Magnetospirillum sp. UT-4]CAA7623144.1 Addiction module killer protein [Magnetospirillum sp. UT-4]
MPAVLEYLDEQGASPFGRWFERLDARAAAKVAVARIKLAAGHMGNVKAVGEGVSEYRIDHGPGYRLYFGNDGTALILLLLGGDKTTQPRDIAQAKALWQDYRKRKKANP